MHWSKLILMALSVQATQSFQLKRDHHFSNEERLSLTEILWMDDWMVCVKLFALHSSKLRQSLYHEQYPTIVRNRPSSAFRLHPEGWRTRE